MVNSCPVMGDIMYDTSSLLNAHVFIVHYYIMNSINGITAVIAIYQCRSNTYFTKYMRIPFHLLVY